MKDKVLFCVLDVGNMKLNRILLSRSVNLLDSASRSCGKAHFFILVAWPSNGEEEHSMR